MEKSVLLNFPKVSDADFTAKNISNFTLFPGVEILWKGTTFCIVSAESPETRQKLHLSTKVPHQKIRRNYGIFHSVFFLVLFGKSIPAKIKFRPYSRYFTV